MYPDQVNAREQARLRIQLRLDTIFELRTLSFKVLKKMAAQRGIQGWSDRAELMRKLYEDIVNHDIIEIPERQP